MPSKLSEYIREQLNKGYNLYTIKNYLIRYGYKAKDIDSAINEIYHPSLVKHTIHFSPGATAAIISIFLGIIIFSGVMILLNNGSKVPDQLLDVKITGIKTEVFAGEKISFSYELENMGKKSNYDVNLRHELRDSNTYKTVTFVEETVAVTKEPKTFEKEILIPTDTNGGNYILRTIASYGTQTASAMIPAVVKEKEESKDENFTQAEPKKEDPPEEKKEEDKSETKEPDETKPKEDNEDSDLSPFDNLEKIKEIARNNPSNAAEYCLKMQSQTSKDICYEYVGEESGDLRYCEEISDERTRDTCYKNVAKKTKNPQVCEKISKDDKRDICYMSFVTEEEKDFSVCEKVSNPYLKQSCDSLKQLTDINSEDLSFYQDLLNEKLLSYEFK